MDNGNKFLTWPFPKKFWMVFLCVTTRAAPLTAVARWHGARLGDLGEGHMRESCTAEVPPTHRQHELCVGDLHEGGEAEVGPREPSKGAHVQPA
jgi:hypothetical protein